MPDVGTSLERRAEGVLSGERVDDMRGKLDTKGPSVGYVEGPSVRRSKELRRLSTMESRVTWRMKSSLEGEWLCAAIPGLRVAGAGWRVFGELGASDCPSGGLGRSERCRECARERADWLMGSQSCHSSDIGSSSFSRLGDLTLSRMWHARRG